MDRLVEIGQPAVEPLNGWDRIRRIVDNGRRGDLEAHDTKGARSPFSTTALGGAFPIKIQCTSTPEEGRFLGHRHGTLPPTAWSALIHELTTLETGEMKPHSIQWSGFGEGHRSWRTDPIAIAFVVGLRSLEEIEAPVPQRLPRA